MYIYVVCLFRSCITHNLNTIISVLSDPIYEENCSYKGINYNEVPNTNIASASLIGPMHNIWRAISKHTCRYRNPPKTVHTGHPHVRWIAKIWRKVFGVSHVPHAHLSECPLTIPPHPPVGDCRIEHRSSQFISIPISIAYEFYYCTIKTY